MQKLKKFKLITGIFTLILLAGCATKVENGEYAPLAQCLTDKGVKFYGAFWCPHCTEQKRLFGSDTRYITYIECDPRGANSNPAACKEAGVVKYPTWFFPGQGNLTGVFTPEELAKKANCEQDVPASSTTATPSTTLDPTTTATPTPTVDPTTTATTAPTVDPSTTATTAPTVDPSTTATPTPTVDPSTTATPSDNDSKDSVVVSDPAEAGASANQ